MKLFYKLSIVLVMVTSTINSYGLIGDILRGTVGAAADIASGGYPYYYYDDYYGPYGYRYYGPRYSYWRPYRYSSPRYYYKYKAPFYDYDYYDDYY